MKRRFTLSLSLVALLCCLPFLSAQPEDDEGHVATFIVPLTGNANPVFTSNPCIITNHETAIGKASFLGELAWDSNETVNLCTLTGLAVVDGTFTLTAANGDQIKGVYHTVGVLSPATGFKGKGSYMFLSGTGRFSGVTGGGVVQAVGAAAPPFALSASLRGVIALTDDDSE